MAKTILRLRFTFFILLFQTIYSKAEPAPPPPTINELIILTPITELNTKFEASIDLTATFSNPYDYDQITVKATFTSPSGIETTVDGFFMQDYTLNETTGNLLSTGQGEFRVRFSPRETGMWNFVVSVTDSTGTTASQTDIFSCSDVSTPANHGFLRTGQTNYLQFDDDTPYIAIGENIAWQINNPYLNYKEWLTKLIDYGGNFFRLWHAHWGLGIEWSNGNGFEGLRRYKQTNCFYQDWLFDFCAENGVYIMLTLQHHGPVSTQANPNWNDSPYNVANGGPCQNTIDFFTNEEARQHTKNRYRYIIARWGYSRSILCWELFNEVYWTDNFQANKPLVADWHLEMAEYLKTTDPNEHLITTSYGDDFTDENVWANPDFDLTQTHIYVNTPNIERVLANGTRNFLTEFDKPTLNGEFGLGATASLANQDPDGIHLHNSLWGSLFSGALGTAMTWWWDSYIHPKDLYYHFWGLSQMAKEVPFIDKNLSPENAYVTGAPGDLLLIPYLDWGGIGEKEISIDEKGVVSPMGAALGQFLYGSLWSTQYRSPPTFTINYSAEGEFKVTTSDEAGTGPKIAIWLDSVLQLEQTALPNSSYAVSVPAGAHTIKVDNTGVDWISIASYTFEGLGSQIDAYVLVSEEQNIAAGWALNNSYNHQYIAANGTPLSTPSSSVVVEGFQNGSYAVQWFDPLTGTIYGEDIATANNGILNIPLTSFLWDVAFIVEDSPVATEEARENLAFEIYPNPAKAGVEVSLDLSLDNSFSYRISLLDMTGREFWAITNSNDRFQLPAEVPTGFYWVKIEQNGKSGVKPIVVIN